MTLPTEKAVDAIEEVHMIYTKTVKPLPVLLVKLKAWEKLKMF
jgi:hypothetical protein